MRNMKEEMINASSKAGPANIVVNIKALTSATKVRST